MRRIDLGSTRRRRIPQGLGLAIVLGFSLAAHALTASPAAETHRIRIFEGRQVAVSVPAGWAYAESRDSQTGVPTVQLAEPRTEIELAISFMPDSEGRLGSREFLETMMRKLFGPYTKDSVEKEMKFTSLDSADGLGAFTVFTDSRLAGKKIPKGERLISTSGIRAFKGAYLVFTLLSNSRDTPEYSQGLDIVRSVAEEKPATAGSSEGFTAPAVPWVLRVADPGMVVSESKVKPDGSSAYFMMSDKGTGMNLSFFIEPAQKCKTSRECRDMVQKAGFAHIGKVEGVAAADIGDVSVVECFLPETKGMAVKQQNMWAEFVVQGFWVDAHLSKVAYTPADRERFVELVKGLSFEPKKN